MLSYFVYILIVCGNGLMFYFTLMVSCCKPLMLALNVSPGFRADVASPSSVTIMSPIFRVKKVLSCDISKR